MANILAVTMGSRWTNPTAKILNANNEIILWLPHQAATEEREKELDIMRKERQAGG